jgi:mannose-6-phosphate isomerase-like protein (cupin superfamily)
MPYVSPTEAPNLPELDIDAVSREMGPAPWRKPLIGTAAMRWVLMAWPPGYVTIPHLHPRGDEVFLILRGEAVFRFGNAEPDRHVGPARLLWARHGVLHTIGVPGPEPLLMLCSLTPNEDAPDETIERPEATGVTLPGTPP